MAKAKKGKKISKLASGAGSSGPVSMTGFGGAQGKVGTVAIEVEIRCSNGRFLDPVIRLPREYSALEGEFREQLSSQFSRGRVELFISRQNTGARAGEYRFNKGRYDELLALYRSLAKAQGCLDELEVEEVIGAILSRSEVLEFSAAESSPDKELVEVRRVVARAIAAAAQSRAAEGARLAADISARCKTIILISENISRLMSTRPAEVQERLRQSVGRLLKEQGAAVDQGRLLQEVAFLADRFDVTEELTRLQSHFTQFAQILRTPPSGKKLDFLIQELVREFNTIGSKAQEATIQHLVVDAKTEVERIREQVQNLE